jgi:predicted AAA+ superfamily ATPase
MRQKTVITENLRVLATAEEIVAGRNPGLPGIIVVHGPSGHGKTTSVAWLAIQKSAVFVTALPVWSAHGMLCAIAKELGKPPMRSATATFEMIAHELTVNPRAIFLDESDAIADKKDLTETLRVLHDLTAVPLVIVGMNEFKNKLARRPQLARRVLREVEFRLLPFADLRLMATELSEVEIADDVVELLQRKSRGSAGLFCVELARAEEFARRRGMDRLDVAAFAGVIGNRPSRTEAAAA